MPRSGYKAIFVPFTRGVRLMAPGSAIIDATSIRSKSPAGNLLACATTKSDREFHRRPGHIEAALEDHRASEKADAGKEPQQCAADRGRIDLRQMPSKHCRSPCDARDVRTR